MSKPGAVVVVGDDAVLRVAVGDEPHGLRLVLLGRTGEAVHEHDRQRDVVGQRRERVDAVLVGRGPFGAGQPGNGRIDGLGGLGGLGGRARVLGVVGGTGGNREHEGEQQQSGSAHRIDGRPDLGVPETNVAAPRSVTPAHGAGPRSGR